MRHSKLEQVVLNFLFDTHIFCPTNLIKSHTKACGQESVFTIEVHTTMTHVFDIYLAINIVDVCITHALCSNKKVEQR